MDIKTKIQDLLDIEINTDDLLQVISNPEACTDTPESAAKLEDLVLLLSLRKESPHASDR